MEKPQGCYNCPIYEHTSGFSVPDGKGTNGVVIVGDSINLADRAKDKVFYEYGDNGFVLNTVFQNIGVSREQFYFTNLQQCELPKILDKDLRKNGLDYCTRGHFHNNISNHSPGMFNRVIVALGNEVFKTLTGMSGVKKENISMMRGYVFPSKYGWVVPTLDPTYLRRGNPNLIPFMEADIRKAIKIARGEYDSFKGGKGYLEPKYQTSPGIDEAKSFLYRVKDSGKLILSYDIETPMPDDLEEDERDTEVKIIRQIQFSLGIGEGIAFPWEGEYVEISRQILGMENVKANHNTWLFDNPILRDNGIQINSIIHDTQWMFKHWHPSLERGLQKVANLFNFPFPWKHLYGSQLAYYGCADVDAVQYILKYLPPLMQKENLWKGYFRYNYQINQAYTKASDRGLPIRLDKHDKLVKEFKIEHTELDKKMQELYPDELKGVFPRRKDEFGNISYGYVREPKEVKILSAKWNEIKGYNESKGLEIPHKGRFIYENSFKYDEDGELDRNGLQVIKVEEDGEELYRWGYISNFKPSQKQIVEYLKYKQEGCITKVEKELYKVPKKIKADPNTGIRKDTTGSDELQDIFDKTGDPLIEAIIRFRSVDKMLSNDLPNWYPNDIRGDYGFVHCQWGYKAPQGQKNAFNPNILNASNHSENGKRFREIIEAPPGRLIAEFDKQRFHVAMMGFISEDEDYIRFAKLDPYCIFGSWIVKEFDRIEFKWSNEEIKLACKEFKKRYPEVRQGICKPTVLGNQLGLGARKLQYQNRKYIHSIYDAEHYQEVLKAEFPRVAKKKESILDEAHLKHKLINYFNRVQYFWEIYKWEKTYTGGWVKKNGKDAEKALAFAVQSNSFGMIDEEILRMEELGYNERFWFFNLIHDSVVDMPLNEDKDKCIELVYQEMMKPCPMLVNKAAPNGLVVAVDIKIGKNMKDMEEIKI